MKTTIKHNRYNSKGLLLLATASIFLSLSACVEDVPNFVIPEVESKLVVTSFISPNDSIRVKVSKSVPLNYNQVTSGWDNYYQPVSEATVVITNTSTSHSATIPYRPELGQFILPPTGFTVEAGKEYSLNVSAPGLIPVYAKTVVPLDFPEIVSYKIDTIVTQSEWEGEYTEIIFSGIIKDVGGIRNYYAVGFSVVEESYDPYNDTTYTWSWYFGGTLFSDSDRDGEEISFKKTLSYLPAGKFSVNLLSTDESYFHYHNSFYNWVSDNPFSEPSPIFTNVEGGLGVFSSYLITSININENP